MESVTLLNIELGKGLAPEPMLTYCQLNPQEQTAVLSKLKCKILHSRKCIWKFAFKMAAILFTP